MTKTGSRGWMAVVALAGFLAGCATTSEPEERRITYDCDQGGNLTVVYEENQARVTMADGTELVLPQRVSGSGLWYETPTHSLRSRGTELTWTVGRMVPIQCRQNNTANM